MVMITPLRASPVARRHEYPVFPSVKASVRPEQYRAAVEALKDVPRVFYGDSILVPEYAVRAIEMLRDRFGASLEYGAGTEWEFANKARRAGVCDRVISLGNAVSDVTGVSADEMLRQVLEGPESTEAAWRELYQSSKQAR